MVDPIESAAQEAAYRVRKLGRRLTVLLWAVGLGLYTLWATMYWSGFESTQNAVSCIGPLGAECPESWTGPSVTLVSDVFFATFAGLVVLSVLMKILFSFLANAAYRKTKGSPTPQPF
ncbi:MAG: hypothetical protein ACI9KE_004793 [Polyangiales bacterium]|jgi:hypothetical protein